MNMGAIFIGFAILVVAIPYVINPLLRERKKLPIKAASQKTDGKERHKDVLAAIRELDFDFQTGKVTREDYETLRAQLVLEAAEYLQMKQQEDEEVEALIRARLEQVKTPVKCEQCGGDIRPQDLFCPACGVPVKNQVGSGEPVAITNCPGCGKSVKEGDMFCAVCGTRLSEQPTSGNAAAIN